MKSENFFENNYYMVVCMFCIICRANLSFIFSGRGCLHQDFFCIRTGWKESVMWGHLKGTRKVHILKLLLLNSTSHPLLVSTIKVFQVEKPSASWWKMVRSYVSKPTNKGLGLLKLWNFWYILSYTLPRCPCNVFIFTFF